MHHGEPVEMELIDSDPSAGSELVLRAAGDRAERGLAADERLIVETIAAVLGNNKTASLVASLTDNGTNAPTIPAGAFMAPLGPGVNFLDFSHTVGGGMSGDKGRIPLVIGDGVALTGTGVIVKG
jgi:hypothetical protein